VKVEQVGRASMMGGKRVVCIASVIVWICSMPLYCHMDGHIASSVGQIQYDVDVWFTSSTDLILKVQILGGEELIGIPHQ
jgi:hypothetical protein